MIVVVASSHDARAQNIAAHWGPRCAALLTAEDLCKPGWTLPLPGTEAGASVIGGKIVPASDINGVLTLRPRIFPQELQSIRAADRPYVAAELNAFLQVWLTVQTCPVLNRPTASCLAGPNWRPEQWTYAAAAIGIPVRTHRRSVPANGDAIEDESGIEIVAVGGRLFGCDDATLKAQTLQLARKAGVELLSARFSRKNGCFLSAHAWPDLSNLAILAAVCERLEERR